MARYQCRACGFDGLAPWSDDLRCPRCGNRTRVRVILLAEDRTEAGLSAATAGRYGSADWGEDG